MSRKAEGNAHGKLILIGEHSVVYDKPAIALPFPAVRTTALIEQLEKNSGVMLESDYYSGSLSQAPEMLSGIRASIDESLRLLQAENEMMTIRIRSTIPSGRGLGSSAAVAHAVVKAIFNYFDAPLPHDVQMHLVQIAETHAHGNPSGIDMEATSSDRPIWFQRGSQLRQLSFVQPFYIVVGDTGHYGDTRKAVSGIRELYFKQPTIVRKSIDMLGEYTYECERSLTSGDIQEVGKYLDLAQLELSRLGVSDQSLDHLIAAARSNGALGAKLTGGGRGGCMLAIAQHEQHAKTLSSALLEAGAFQTWTSFVNYPHGDE